MYTSWGKFLLVVALMVGGDNFANFVTLQLGALLLLYVKCSRCVTALRGSFLVTTVLSGGSKHVDVVMNRGLQSRRPIVFC